MTRALRARFLRCWLCASLLLAPTAAVTVLTTGAALLASCGGAAPVVTKKKAKKRAKKKAPPSPFASARTSLPACDALVDQAESLISPDFGKRVRAQLVNAAPAFGDEVAQRVLPRILEHAVEWARGSATLCMRHVSQAAVSKAEYQKRMACHGEAFARLRALANVLEHADTGIAEWALPTLSDLDELFAQCGRGGVWKGYDVDPVPDAKLMQALADIAILERIHRPDAMGKAIARARAEADITRSRMLKARVLLLSVPGRAQEAGEQTLQQALELFEQASTAHGHMLVQGAAARFYTHLEQPNDALAHAEELIVSCDAVHGAGSRTCAGERRRATLVLGRAGRGEEALAIGKEALATLLGSVGDLHPETLMTRVALVSLELQHGSAAQAQKHIDVVLQAGPNVYGPAHPLVGDQLRMAAHVALRGGDLAGALALTERAVELHQAAHGDLHERLADDHALLGRIASKRGEAALAASAYDRALAIRRRLNGSEDPVLAQALKDAAVAYIERGDPPPKVLKYLEQAKELDVALLGDDNTAVAIDLRLLGRYWAARGKYRKAYALHLESVKRLSALHGPDHQETKRSTRELDAAVRGQGI